MPSPARDSRTPRRHRVAMLLENLSYPRDVRVRREARALVTVGHQVTVIAPRGPGEPRRDTIDGVHVRRFRVPEESGSTGGIIAEYAAAVPQLHLAAIRELAAGATVLHLHNPPDLLFGAGLIARLLGRQVVFDQHDLFPELVSEKVGSRLVHAMSRLGERLTFAVASHAVVANESHAEVARRRGAMASDRITVVRNGPPESTIAEQPTLRPGSLSDPELIYVGMLASQDGATALAGLLARVRREPGTEGARLTVVGEGEDRPALEAALAAEGVAHCTTITGWVAAEEVRSRLAGADICVDPSPPTPLNDKSTMIKIGEYLAAGKPVVAYELRETGRTAQGAARLVRPGDVDALAAAVAELARDPQSRSELAQAGLKRAHEISWERSAAALVDVYDRL